MKELSGTINLPGDKSITHRALLLAATTEPGRMITLHNWLASLDCIATRSALEQMGVEFCDLGPHLLQIRGVGLHGLAKPLQMLDVGNSGTSMRLLTGILAAQQFSSSITGDASLCKRPMGRIIQPLSMMGAKITAVDQNYAPLMITGGQQLRSINYAMPMASAQVKSAILLASLYAEGTSTITSPGICRNHTEILLKNLTDEIYIPNDISAAAFFIVAATITPGSDILLPNVGINPTRTAFLDVLLAMGADITLSNIQEFNGENRADIRVKAAKKLCGFTLDKSMIANAIDEIPILCLAAACASGSSIIIGAKELRYKESDRIALIANGLRTLGVQVEEYPDGLKIIGGKIGGGAISTNGDHRIAMTFAVARLVAQQEIIIQDSDCVATSFPRFHELLKESLYA